MNKAKIISVILAILVIIAFIYVGNKSSLSTENPIKIGQISALSGVGSDIGVEERNGALLGVEEINKKGGILNRKIELVSEDVSLDKLNQTGSSFQKLVHVDNVVAIVGPQWDEPGSIAVALSKDLQIPVVSPNVSPQVESEVNSEYFFSTFYSNKVGIEVLLKFAQEKGYKRIAIIQPANFGFWKYTSDLFKNSAKESGIEIVTEEYGDNFGNTDYKTLIAKAKQSNPDAIFGSYADLECLFLQQAKNQGLMIPLLSTESAGTPKALADCGGILQDSLYFSTPKQEGKYMKFEEAYEKRFGAKPLSPTAVTAYDAMYIVAESIQNGKSAERAVVRDEIEKIVYTDGASMSEIKFDQKGFVVTDASTFMIKTVQDSNFVEVK